MSPRSEGDSLLLATDVVQLRRIVAGLDTPAPGSNEFQRADVAPIATLGDGILDAADLAQSRRDIIGLDAPRPAGGPVQPSGLGFIETLWDEILRYFTRRELSIGEAVGLRGKTISVDIDLNSLGDETASSFTLEFDPTVLKNPTISLDTSAWLNSVLTINDLNADKGKIGILLDSDTVIVGQRRNRILILSFEVADNAPIGKSYVRFSDDIVSRAIADANGNRLDARFVNGIVLIVDQD